jgi:hypothetical protein
MWRCIVGISVERVCIEEGARRLMVDERQRLHKEARKRQGLASSMRKERREQENQKRKGGDD